MKDYRDNRLTPEELLEAAKREESQSNTNKGKLKIFLGMAAGVGKTYAMLEEAQILKQSGIDVVVGLIDTHGRNETGLLLRNLEITPPQKVPYRDKLFNELNLDAILARKPDIVLIDELAHSNIPGVRHIKRWEDVIEILDDGIDVYTTLNIQHIESLKNIVESLADISIRETVPDQLFNSNTSIQLIDLTPDELLVRLHSGRVYLGAQSQVAARNFFQKERLTALREITLRYVAEIVDSDLRGMIPTTGNISKDWHSKEKLLVAISHHPHSQKLLRTARRLAFNMDLPWIALHVNDSRELTENESIMLIKNISLAQDLGAEFISTNNIDIASGIKHIAHQHKINLLVVGRPHKSIYLFNRDPLFERLSRECDDIDILVIKEDFKPSSNSFPLFKFTKNESVMNYLHIGLLCALLAVTNYLILPYVGYKVCGFIFLMGILLFSLHFKKGPLLLSALIASTLWLSFFTNPNEVISLQAPEDIILPVLYFVTAAVSGILAERIRRQKDILQRQEESNQALYEIVHHILDSTSINETLVAIESCLERTLEGNCEILLLDFKHRAANASASKLIAEENERHAALWVFENGKEAGLSTSTLPLCKNFYVPITGLDNPVAVIVYRPQGQAIITNEKNFLYNVSQHLSLYIAQHADTNAKIA